MLAEHLLDWFHVTMRMTVLKQIAKGLPEKVGEEADQYELRPRVLDDLESVKWYLWHGNVFQALNELQGLEMDLDGAVFETENETARKLLKGVEELHTYVERNQSFIPNYGERYRNGERIATGFVESAVNQVISKRMVKHQQMGWSQRGAQPPTADPNTSAQRGMGKHVLEMVPRISAGGGGQERYLTPRNLLLSWSEFLGALYKYPKFPVVAWS